MTDELDVERLPYPSRIDTIPLPRGPLDLWRPPRIDELLEDMIRGPYDPEEKLPYWADLWPAAIGLAEAVDDGAVPVRPGEDWLELGCGLGLVALAAARRGARVVATDWIPEALAYVEASAELAGLKLATRRVDWREPPEDVRPARVLASDVLYEARNGAWLGALLAQWRRPGFEMWVADPGRAHADRFFSALEGFDVRSTSRPIRGSHVPTGEAVVRIHHLRG